MQLVVVILLIYILTTIGIGVYFNRKSATVSEFVLGGRSVGPWITAFAYGTSYFSAVVFIGYAGQFGWKYGVASTWVGIANALIGSLAAWAIMGRRTRVMSKHLNSATMPEFLGQRYRSKSLKVASAIIAFVFLIPYTASVYNGLSRLFSMVFTLPYEACVIGMAVITAVYVILGGYKATAYNDFVQGIIMIIGIIAVVMAVLANNGGFYTSLRELSQIEVTSGELEGIKGGFTSFFGPDPINLLGVAILTSLGTWGLPQMVHKFYTIKDERSIKAGTVVSTVFALIIAGGCYFLGGFGRLFVAADASGMPVGGYDEIIPTMMQGLPDILLGIIVVMVLSASMSTLSSLVLTSSSTITLDLIRPILKKRDKASEKAMLIIMRTFIAVFLLISVLIALNKNALISDMMGYSWGALAGAFLAPFLLGLFWKRVTKEAVMTNFVVAIGLTALHFFTRPTGTFLGFSVGSPVNLGAFTMLLGLVIVPLVSLVTKKPDKAHIESVFSCYDQRVEVKHGVALTENEPPVTFSEE